MPHHSTSTSMLLLSSDLFILFIIIDQSVQAGIQTHVHLNDAYKYSSRDIRTVQSKCFITAHVDGTDSAILMHCGSRNFSLFFKL